MFQQRTRYHRRRFLQTIGAASAAFAVPHFVPASALGKDGGVAASERIVMGGIGIGNRGTYDLGCFLPEPDVQFIAICDVKAERRAAAKKMVDQRNGNQDCATYRDLRELLARDDIDAVLIATGPNWHATAATLAANAGKDVYCEKPCTKNIAQSLALAETFRRTGRVFQAGTQRRNLPAFCVCLRAGAHRQARQTSEGLRPSGGYGDCEQRLGCSRAGTAAGRSRLGLVPRSRRLASLSIATSRRFQLRKRGRHGGGRRAGVGFALRRSVPMGQQCGRYGAVEYNPPENDVLVARYENDVKLVIRNEGWLPLGSCPVRFEGDAGWIETGDSGQFVLSSPALLAGRKVEEIGGYPATFHVRDFLNCVKSRGKPLANADVACYSHITCHAANIAVFLQRKLTYDPRKNEFLGDEAANRLRSEALREPWRV